MIEALDMNKEGTEKKIRALSILFSIINNVQYQLTLEYVKKMHVFIILPYSRIRIMTPSGD